MKLKDAAYLFSAPVVSAWALVRAGVILEAADPRTIFMAAGYAALAILVPACAALVFSLSSLRNGRDLERHSSRAETATRVCEVCAAAWGICFLAVPIVALTGGFSTAKIASLVARAAILSFILPLSFRVSGYIRVYIHDTYYVA